MIHDALRARTRAWLDLEDSPVRALTDHIRRQGRLRRPQVEAIETWLYLKVVGGGRALAVLFAEGLFAPEVDLDAAALPSATRDRLKADLAARALYAFAAAPDAMGRPALPELEAAIRERPQDVDFEGVIRAMFYGVDYADYLFSLPMGAGKTFLMAALIHLELYLARQSPDSPAFGRNFLLLIPSGLKTSIVPSLRTIAHFDPTWVLPEPAASEIHRALRFEVLDEAKTGKKSNKARNPNAQKVAAHQPFEDASGVVFVVNAEKVILDRVPDDVAQFELLERSDDEKDKAANELRALLGRLPRLTIHVDEVHHAQTDDVKLRRVIGRWAAGGNVASVLGYSGTPYLSKAEDVAVAGGVKLRFGQITNTVYFYPLLAAVRTFLKKPVVKTGRGLTSAEIVERGVDEFRARYEATVYADGTRAKLAVYCGTIARCETDVLPQLLERGVPRDEILVYHKGNKQHPMPADAARAFARLDRPESPHRYVLLVQIGKEGWDCRSLTAVVLSQKKDSPPNMVLQTSCRCLRQVTAADDEATALVWLSEDNAKLLNKQLADEQKASIAALNEAGKGGPATPLVPRHDRTATLAPPPLDYVAFRVRLTDETVEAADPAAALARLVETVEAKDGALFRSATEETRAEGVLAGQRLPAERVRVIARTGHTPARFDDWLLSIHRDGLGLPTLAALRAHEGALRRLFGALTHEAEGRRVFNDLYDRGAVERRVRLAFHARRQLTTEEEEVPKKAAILAGTLSVVPAHPLLFPPPADVARILALDAGADDDEADRARKREELRAVLEAQGRLDLFDGLARDPEPAPPSSPAVRHRGRTLHYAPYDFSKTALEHATLGQLLTLDTFTGRDDLEVYFVGAPHLTEFALDCYKKAGARWQRVGIYTPDFLVLQRGDDGRYRRVLVLETKGAGFLHEPGFQARKTFVEAWFVPENNRRAGYERFRYCVLTDEHPENVRARTLDAALSSFFAD